MVLVKYNVRGGGNFLTLENHNHTLIIVHFYVFLYLADIDSVLAADKNDGSLSM